MKRAKRAQRDPLHELALLQRLEPGRLASWLRAQRPMREQPQHHRAHFITTVDLKK